jgi:hypothetical protein|tara:strand:+ start:4898 stop:5278 length:381 start_codon:yes stop_codon:yes gene_type:complete
MVLKKSTKLNKKPENTSDSKPKRDKKGRLLPGNSGNLKGKPKGSISLIAILKKRLNVCPKGQNKKTYAAMIIDKMILEAMRSGDVNMLRLIFSYVEGMPKQSLDINDPAKVELIKSLENIVKSFRK